MACCDEPEGKCACRCGRQRSRFGDELGKLLRKFRKAWFSKIKERGQVPDWKPNPDEGQLSYRQQVAKGMRLSHLGQFGFAFLGSMTYIVVFVVMITEGQLFVTLAFDFFWGIFSYLGMMFAIGGFFAWLVTYRSSRAGPVRLYLSGLALPALVAVMTGYSLQIFSSVPAFQGAVEPDIQGTILLQVEDQPTLEGEVLLRGEIQ